MKKRIMGALLALLLMPALSCAQEMYTIAEIREQVEQIGRWTQTYEVNGRTVEVDVPIEVPDVDALPVLRINDDKLHADPANADAGVEVFNDGTWIEGGLPRIFCGYGTGMRPREARTYSGKIDRDAPLSGSIGMTAGELLETMAGIVRQYYGEALTLSPNYLSERTEWHEFDETGPSWGEIVVFEEPVEKVDDYGDAYWQGMDAYEIEAFQMIRGVPVICGMSNMMNGGSSDPREGRAESGWIRFEYADGGWWLGGYGLVESEVAYEDVPLCGFEAVKAQAERLIERGNLRRVNAVRLGYVVGLDPEGGERWLVPMWILDGRYTRYADSEDKPAYMVGVEEEYRREQIGVNAQTGKLFDPTNQSRKRCNAPEIITWEDVK